MQKKLRKHQNKENIYNLPNFISLYRLMSIPILWYIAYSGNEKVFFYLFLLNMFTDVLDGFIARKFNLQTKFGAKLDSIADFFMYLLAMYAMIHFKWEELQMYKYSFFAIMFYYLAIDLFSLVKFREIARLHLISSKVAGVIEGMFFLLLFSYGFVSWLYWLMFIVASYSFIENMYYLVKLNKMQSNLRGFFWNKAG